MADIKLYLDEDISDKVAVVLRSQGFDVISAHEVKMRGTPDEEQLRYAITHKRAILSRNVCDFVPLAIYYAENMIPHFGIIVTKWVNFNELLRRIRNLLRQRRTEEIENRLVWLQNYK